MLTFHMIIYAIFILITAVLLHVYISLKYDYDLLYMKLQHDEKSDLEEESLPDLSNFYSTGSSIWCHGDHRTNRTCRFRNLCYATAQDIFLFFHSPDSIIVGVPKNRFSPALQDMSSVEDHNMQYFNFQDVPLTAAKQFTIHFIKEISLIFNRFNPDNLMHVIHDDLLPMFFTLQDISLSPDFNSLWDQNMQLIFMEGWISGQFISLYELFSNKKPLLKKNLFNFGTDLVCFQHAFVGITKRTIWYQYGFRVPQGPIFNPEINAQHVRSFTNFISSRLDVAQFFHTSNFGVLLSRNINRLILNEKELIDIFAKKIGIKILTLSLENNSISYIIAAIKSAKILLGMHGSLLSLAVFLSPGAILLELFPYAINPADYTPYKTLSSLPGMGIMYHSWRNKKIKNTITHEDYPKELGGIQHLSKEEQIKILENDEIQPHLCCQSSEWLFRIYQDTVVDVSSFEKVLESALFEQNNFTLLNNDFYLKDIQQKYFFPGEVSNLSCVSENNISPGLNISWNLPWNMQYLQFKDIKYEVWIHEKYTDNSFAWILRKSQYFFHKNLKLNTEYNIWVRCVGDENIGPFNHYHVGCIT